MAYLGPGNWEIGNTRLPELNITEFFGGKKKSLDDSAYRTAAAESGTPLNASSIIVNSSASYPRTTTTSGSGSGLPSSGGDGGDGDIPKGDKPDEPSLEDLLRDVHKQYAPVLSDIDQRIQMLEPQKAEFMGNLASQYGTQQGLVQNALEQGQTQLQQNEAEAYGTEKKTLRTLADDIRNLLNAGNMKLGSMGASDSSATEMLKYALAKQGNRRTADVVGQTRDIIGKIRNIGVQLQQQAQDKLLRLEQWKAEQEMDINKFITDLKNKLLDARGNVKMDLSQDTVDQLKAEYAYAKERRDAVEDQYTGIQQQLAIDYEMRRRNIEEYAQQLALNNQYSGGYATNYGQLSGLGQTAGQTQLQGMAPIAYGGETDEDNQFAVDNPNIYNYS